MIANPSTLAAATGPTVGPDVILGWLITGRTRAEILAENPSLTDADIDAVLVSPATTRRIPDITIDGRRLTLAEIITIRPTEAMSLRVSAMIAREKRGRSELGEKQELDDAMALEHGMRMAKALALRATTPEAG